MKKNWIWLPLVLAVAGLAYFLGKPSQPEVAASAGKLTFAIENDVGTLDPIRLVDVFGIRVTSQVCEGLVALDAENKLVPTLAESWEANAAMDRWKFKLRSGVHFHEHDCFGPSKTREFTAADVAYSFGRMLSKDSVSAPLFVGVIDGAADFAAGKAPDIRGIKQLSDHEVEFALTVPDAGFVHRLANPKIVIVPKEAVALGNDVFGQSVLVGTGPFKFAGRSGTELTLNRNTAYWNSGKSNIGSLVFRVIKEDQIRLQEMRNKRVDTAFVPIPSLRAVFQPAAVGKAPELQLSWQKDFQVQTHSVFNTYFLGFNTVRLSRPLRRAASFAINRAEVNQAVANGTASIAAGPIPLATSGFTPAVTGDIFDVAKAKSEMDAASLPPEKRRIEILVHDLISSEQIGEVIQSQLKNAGIEVVLVKLSFNAVVERVLKGDFDATVLAFEYNFDLPALNLAGFYTSAVIPMPNFFQYRSAEVDNAVAALLKQTDDAASLETVRQVEKLIIDDAPAAFLFQPRQSVLLGKQVSGLRFNGFNIALLRDAVVR